MCGIAGILDFRADVRAAHETTLRRMNDAQRHRGPDGEGFHFDRHCGLAHRRLAVIDLADGRQPMQTADGALTITYNGELYNFRELRAELERLGRRFRTRSDTEVVLEAFAEWGPACLDRFNGDFAFAVWNQATEVLFLARDRLGVKPLHYTQVGGALLFASEVKGLLADPRVPRVIDEYALVEGLTYFQPLQPRTLIRDVRMLEPGHCMTADRDGIRVRRYWDLAYRPHTDDLDTTRQRVAALLEDATRLRMVSDVPICGLLSGGLDSSILCTLMARHSARPVDTFSLNFAGNHAAGERAATHIHGDDTDFAARVAREIGARHHEVIVRGEEYFDLLPSAARARDLPVALGSEVGIHRLCQEVKRDATVAISGEGADEVCLGYYMMMPGQQQEPRPFFVVPFDRMAFVLNPGFRMRHRPIRYLRQGFEDFTRSIPEVWGDERTRALTQTHYIQIKYVLPYMLNRADHLSMASGVELRVPFCDHRFVEYYFNVPAEMKFTLGIEKHLLRESFRGTVYAPVLDRKKSIFPYPSSRDAMERLYADTFRALRGRGRAAGRVFARPLLQLLVQMTRRRMVPTIGSHYMCSTALTFQQLSDELSLSLN